MFSWNFGFQEEIHEFGLRYEFYYSINKTVFLHTFTLRRQHTGNFVMKDPKTFMKIYAEKCNSQ